MSRNLKALGLALVAVFAMSSVAASGASANIVHKFTFGANPTFLTASAKTTQTTKIEGAAEEVNCTEFSVSESDKLEGPENAGKTFEAADVTVHPHYGGCTATRNGSTVAATVEPTECTYTFTGETTETTAGEGEHATVHIICPTGQEIHIKVTALKVQCFTVPGGQTLHAIRYENTETGTGHGDIDVKATAHGIKTNKGGACGSGEVNAEYNGEVTLKGHNAGKETVEVHVSH